MDTPNAPARHVAAGGPPTLIMHGEADATVPFDSAERYRDLMAAAGNAVQLIGYPGEVHAFFHAPAKYVETVAAMDAFLVRHGYLEPAVAGLVASLTAEAAHIGSKVENKH
jgi:dipeptidyl aminopeptidase/acylaminoacyl peptidase